VLLPPWPGPQPLGRLPGLVLAECIGDELGIASVLQFLLPE
jgi:hypothetical protein